MYATDVPASVDDFYVKQVRENGHSESLEKADDYEQVV